MGWEELCFLCGLRAGGGPGRLFDGPLKRPLNKIIESLKAQKLELGLSEEQMRKEVEKALQLFEGGVDGLPTGYEEAIYRGSIPPGPYFPFTYAYERWDGWKAIAIGTFDEDSDDDENKKAVTTRLVDEPWDYGQFKKVDGSDQRVDTHAGTLSDNIFCLRAPYSYLQSWIDRDSLPPRKPAFPLEPDMRFEEELYEIVIFRARRHDCVGTLDGIEYEGINFAINQWQDTFYPAFTGAHHLGRALKNGLRGNDLIPALLNDFCVWQTCPPDRWVSIDPSSRPSSHIRVPQPDTNVSSWKNFPAEIMVDILSNLSFKEVLSFTSCCQYLYHKFGNPSFLSALLRTRLRIPLSDVYWFLPVSSVKGEVEKFCEACGQANVSLLNSSDVLFDRDFPLFTFFRTNYPSDSMRNRRRLWRLSQQFRREWYKYRTRGYEVDSEDEEGNNGDNVQEDYSSGEEYSSSEGRDGEEDGEEDNSS
ncbi:hypothetical protein CPB86DRAFT_83410 [Serendipita vermifera]|nr:hypothetical protein CPB86DRAFT_83410 [Serendipita vermifera]